MKIIACLTFIAAASALQVRVNPLDDVNVTAKEKFNKVYSSVTVSEPTSRSAFTWSYDEGGCGSGNGTLTGLAPGETKNATHYECQDSRGATLSCSIQEGNPPRLQSHLKYDGSPPHQQYDGNAAASGCSIFSYAAANGMPKGWTFRCCWPASSESDK